MRLQWRGRATDPDEGGLGEGEGEGEVSILRFTSCGGFRRKAQTIASCPGELVLVELAE
jgi:hypothetical protein